MDKWTHFEFESGANPYISLTNEKTRKVIKAYEKNGWKVEQIKAGFYLVHDKDECRETLMGERP